MSTRVYQIFNCNDDRVATLVHGKVDDGKSPSLNIAENCAVLTKTNTNVYSTADDAINKFSTSSSDSNAMFMVKSNTIMKILGRVNINNYMVLKVQCGSKEGYVYAGKVVQKGSGPNPTYSWDKSNMPYFNLASYTSSEWMKKDVLGIKGLRISEHYYDNLNDGTSLNYNNIVGGESGSNLSEAEDTTETSESETINSMTQASANANGGTGDIDVTYEYAISINPWFATNVEDHYGGTLNNEEIENLLNNKNLIESGYNYSSLKYIFGIPHQFIPTTDCRVGSCYSDDIEKAGYEIAEKIVARLPLLYITPGNTCFMGGSSEAARSTLMGSIGDINKVDEENRGNEFMESSLETMFSEYTGKLYTITPAYVEYFNYVNPLCRAGAIFLDIAGTSFDSTEIIPNQAIELGNGAFANANWGIKEGMAYDFWEEEEATLAEGVEDDEGEQVEDIMAEEETNEEETEPSRAKFEKDYSDFFVKYEDKSAADKVKDFESAVYYSNAIAFYINSEYSFTDSFTNETTDSTLSTAINSLSDRAREIQFLLGTASQAVGEAFDKVDGTLSDIKAQINSIVESVAGGNSIFTTIANSVKTIVSGGRLLFPQIWANSNFSKSYNISIKLITPSTDRVSWWLNIYVPLCHLLALVCPRSEYVNSYTTPFLIKAFYKGMFNIDMGIITEMTFNRGKEGSWTKDGLPTVVDVNFTIQDLYSSMGITSIGSMFKGTTLQNVSEMDYVANLCGININEPDSLRMANLWLAFNITDRIYDFMPNLSLQVESFVSSSVMYAYNNFWF